MELGSRWVKILNDIRGNKTRSLLVVLSIAVGVGVVGIINNARIMLESDLYGEYLQGTPAGVYIYTSPFQEDLEYAVEDMREIERVEARRIVNLELLMPDGEVLDMSLAAVADYSDIEVNIPEYEAGALEPGLREIVIERQSAETVGLEIGDIVVVETADETQYELVVSGIIHDIYEMPYSIYRTVTGYVSMSTIQWMGMPAYYNRLDIVAAENPNDRDHVLDLAAEVRDRVIEPNGYYVGSIRIPGIEADPGEHWAQNQIDGFVLILQIMSVLAIFLSGGLVVNTISAILTQQVKQIGIMRSVGAVPRQIVTMYVFNVFVFSVIGFFVSLPIAWFGSIALVDFASGFLNFTMEQYWISPQIVLIMALLSVAVPIGVALYPIIAGTAISVYRAIYQHGLIQEGGKAWLEKMLTRLSFLSPPAAFSLLNTFRNLPRLSFTLVTLTLAGATFVAAFSTRASLNAQVGELGRYVNYDASISVSSQSSLFTVEREALRVPGVAAAEGWAKMSGVMYRQDGGEGDEIEIIALPYDSIMLDPKIEKGRWLEEDDAWQVVVNEDLIQSMPVELGDQIVIEVMGIDRVFEIIGISSKNLVGPRIYINYHMVSKLSGVNDQVNQVHVRTSLEEIASDEAQDQIAVLLEERLSNAGLTTSSAGTRHQRFVFFTEPFQIILMVLVIMAGLLAVVGGLSLAGTMGINVMERTREIGVLRSVGASNGAVRQVVVVEGVLIALLSWLFVVLVSGPSSASLAGAVIYTILKTDLIFRYSFLGLAIWLVLIVLIGVISSLAPAQNAVMLTVREVLDYEG